MNPSSLQLAIACGLIALGSWFAVHERRNAAVLKGSALPRRSEHAARIRRRAKIAALLVSSGVLFACSYWTDPRRNPVLYLALWGFAFLLASALMWYGFVDFYSLRRQRIESRRAADKQLAHAAGGAPRIDLNGSAKSTSHADADHSSTDEIG